MGRYEYLKSGSTWQSVYVTDDDPPRYITQVNDVAGLKVTHTNFNLNQAAATYDLLTATNGDVWVEIEQAFVKTAAAGLTSLSIATNHATPKSIVGSIARASVTTDLIMTLVVPKFVLPSGKKIQGTIVGAGSGGEIILVVKYFPITADATLV